MRNALCRSSLVALLVVATACSYDSSAPERFDEPISDVNDGLWIASGSSPAILRLAAPQLLAGGRQNPSATVTTSSATLFTINSLAFDRTGTLWVASEDDSLLLAFSPDALAASGFTAASRVIRPTQRSLRAPSAIAFDRLQRLWVANFETGTLVRFDPEQLAASGAPTPAVIISGLSHPTGIAFDAEGSLWVANSRSNTVEKYSGAQLEASGSPTPQVELSAIESSLSTPFALAFDVLGNLWVANVGKRTVVAFSPEALTASGSPAPRVALSSLEGSFGIPVGLAFDAQGSLWVVSGEGALHSFTSATLAATDAPEPSAELLLNGHTLLSGIAFFPVPLGLPIN